MEYPYNLSQEEVIKRIAVLHHADYDLSNPDFDIYDQLLACESVAEAEIGYNNQNPTNSYPTVIQKEQTNENGSVNGNDNGGYKQKVNRTFFEDKHEVIKALKGFLYSTPPIEVSRLLEQLFIDYPSKEEHWLYIAQHWNPRAINRVLIQMIRGEKSGRITLKNPAAYFTFLIKKRVKRRNL